MARYRPERPAWLREGGIPEAQPLPFDPPIPTEPNPPLPYDRYAPEEYKMACSVSGRDGVFLVTWRAQDDRDAQATFLAWLDKGWAVLSQTFWGEPCRYVFRAAAITGFVVLRVQPMP